MTVQKSYAQLCAKMGLPNSESLIKIWKTLCDSREADVAAALPGTAGEIAEKTGFPAGEIQGILDSLFQKGAVFKSAGGAGVYKLAKNIVQFHDSSLLWADADDEFMELWKTVMDVDFPGMMRGLPPEMRLPSFMRVIPVNETLESRSGVLPYEACAELIRGSEKLAVVKCPCRLSQKNCDAPLETCIQINRGAEYALDRGHGREIAKEEALEILRTSEEAGLVHMTENRGFGNAICNCCECCCEMFRLAKSTGKQWILSPSRYRAAVDAALCTACGVCAERCPADAIAVGDTAAIGEDQCLGCGLCIAICPIQAITMEQVRPEEHIPAK